MPLNISKVYSSSFQPRHVLIKDAKIEALLEYYSDEIPPSFRDQLPRPLLHKLMNALLGKDPEVIKKFELKLRDQVTLLQRQEQELRSKTLKYLRRQIPNFGD